MLLKRRVISIAITVIALTFISTSFAGAKPTQSSYTYEFPMTFQMNVRSWLATSVTAGSDIFDGRCGSVYWTRGGMEDTKFTVQVSTSANMANPIQQIVTATSTDTLNMSYKFKNLKGSTTYYARVLAETSRPEWSDTYKFVTTTEIAPGGMLSCT